jgi:hypothetical protein
VIPRYKMYREIEAQKNSGYHTRMAAATPGPGIELKRRNPSSEYDTQVTGLEIALRQDPYYTPAA